MLLCGTVTIVAVMRQRVKSLTRIIKQLHKLQNRYVKTTFFPATLQMRTILITSDS
jgi:hypothetical protein